jgi:hypothetical protein
MDPELPKTLSSTASTTSQLAIMLSDFLIMATKLKADLSSASALLTATHRTVLSQSPQVPDPVFPATVVHPVEPSGSGPAKPVVVPAPVVPAPVVPAPIHPVVPSPVVPAPIAASKPVVVEPAPIPEKKVT